MTNVSRISGAVFDPGALRTIDRAYRRTLRSVAYIWPSASAEEEKRVRDAAAKIIMELAGSGERDADRLHERAYLRVALLDMIG